MEYEELCRNILGHVGGADNIDQALHCITRLRLIVRDKNKVDYDGLKEIEGVLQVIDAAGQVQIVIGTHVEDVYHEFCEMAGISEGGSVDVDFDPDREGEGDILTQTMGGSSDSAKGGRFAWVTRFLDALAAIVTPALYGIIAGGMLKGVTATIVALGWLSSKDPNIVVLNAIADAPFYFMPFVIGYSSANRFKVNPAFGLCVAGMIMYPTFMSNADGLTSLPFLFFSIPVINYKNTIFPVILGVWVFSLIFKVIDKHIHKNVRIVFSGFLAFLIAGPIILAFVAPLGNWIGVGMASFFGTFFTVAGPLAGALFCGIIPLTIIFGIKGWSVVELDNLSRLGYDYMLPNFFYSNLAVSGAVLAASLKVEAGLLPQVCSCLDGPSCNTWRHRAGALWHCRSDEDAALCLDGGRCHCRGGSYAPRCPYLCLLDAWHHLDCHLCGWRIELLHAPHHDGGGMGFELRHLLCNHQEGSGIESAACCRTSMRARLSQDTSIFRTGIKSCSRHSRHPLAFRRAFSGEALWQAPRQKAAGRMEEKVSTRRTCAISIQHGPARSVQARPTAA